jgi:hypothetical protein
MAGEGVDTMIVTNGNDRHPASGDALRKDILAPEPPGGLPHAVACDCSQPGLDGQALLLPWVTAAMASGPPAFVNRMVRRWISRQAFGTERFSAPVE